MRDLQLRTKRETSMTTRGGASFAFLLSMAALFLTFLIMPGMARAQNVQVDLSSTSALCGGQECFNTAGIFNTGIQFLGTSGMDNGNNCTPTPPYTNCPDAYSANQLGLSTSTPPTLTPPSVNVSFNFGAVNTANCGPATSVSCTLNVVNLTSSGVAITLPAAQQAVYSTMIILGTAVNGHHSGTVTANYTDGSSTVFNQTFSDWCGFGGNQYESVAVGGINRLNADGTLNGASCNLYAYTYPADVTKTLQGITLTDTDGSGASFALAITLKPPTYTIDGGTASPSSVAAGSTTTATVTVNPQTGYGAVETETIQRFSCSISPSDSTVFGVRLWPPTCSLQPGRLFRRDRRRDVGTDYDSDLHLLPNQRQQLSLKGRREFLLCTVAARPGTGVDRTQHSFFTDVRTCWDASLLGLLLVGFGRNSGMRELTSIWATLELLPGQYTISVTGVDGNGLSQASNACRQHNQYRGRAA